MRGNRNKCMVWFCALAFLVFAITPALSLASVTIVGTVTGDYRIIAEDEQVYEIGEGEKGDEVVELVGKKVRVTGEVQESEGVKVIDVTSYEVLGE